MNDLNLSSMRAKKARTAAAFGKLNGGALISASLALFMIGVALLIRVSYPGASDIVLGLAGVVFMLGAWHRYDLSNLPPKAPAKSLDDLLEPGLLAGFKKRTPITPAVAWQAACKQWQGRFLTNHLLIDIPGVAQALEAEPDIMPAVWNSAYELSIKGEATQLDAGALAAALLLSSETTKQYLAKQNLRPEDVVEVYSWQERLNRHFHQQNPYFGGIGRDWASGFTPTLDQFGHNFSRSVEAGAGHFHTLAHADILDSVVHNLDSGSGGLALVGEAGTGKTALVYALAQRLLEGRDEKLLYYQIVSLDASQIISAAGDKLEDIMLRLFAEAAHAKNIIIFLDEAELFFGKGTGAFDLARILGPLLQNHSIKIISAFTPNEFQRLKISHEALAANMSVIAVTEPPEATVMKILEDTALTLEQQDGLMVSFEAVREAYRLGGQYYQELAYPGKAIKLLDQAIPYVKNKAMDASSVQSAVEKTRGIKVAHAEAPEADLLLHLEDKIHERMINQERAVKVISSALRRGRAGVANPSRPVGSFLFLGPTGVGKTELARSLAAVYFGDEHRMIRLDMSEYQQPEDVKRLLESGESSAKSLLMSIREQPFSVVLLDEIEKAHVNILNLLLQLLDEGQLTDQNGKSASFKNAIIISTSNAGSGDIAHRVAGGESLEDFERPLIDKLISEGLFKPELINRFDEVVLFRPLNQSEIARVAMLMVGDVNKTLAKQNVKVELTKEALIKIVQAGYDPEFGARPMRRVIQKMVEDTVANRLLSNQAQPGSTITLDAHDLPDEL